MAAGPHTASSRSKRSPDRRKGPSSPEPGGRAPAPDQLRIVQLFINSVDIEAGFDELSSPSALASWLHAHGLSRRQLHLTRADLERAVAFRELLRTMAMRNDGEESSGDVVAEFNRHLRSNFHMVLENEQVVIFDLRAAQDAGAREAAG